MLARQSFQKYLLLISRQLVFYFISCFIYIWLNSFIPNHLFLQVFFFFLLFSMFHVHLLIIIFIRDISNILFRNWIIFWVFILAIFHYWIFIIFIHFYSFCTAFFVLKKFQSSILFWFYKIAMFWKNLH